ncbi:GerW family sporulation protein [Lederbergia wuyishanensis]|uniref:Sporulation protein YtfJ n=1 Tax=Lederbergia wuyishanensis TaxID=1347903 RepID=A0ABU0D530_9BACI|nr:GerW family sporulation protein [Lederbergia wuyishanensis]MCJ8009610.1 GerW family sporulation protein [Lederbergia wuyishanensis]MDQ0343518.1 sporulation protein YtfJ [Lederbergia wuyishanensis]
MDEHPIQGVMTTAMENLKEMIDVNTIIGDPVETPDGGVILTVSKVGFGFAMGGSEFKSGGSSGSSDDEGGQGSYLPFGGGSGGGVSITPIAFLIVNKHGVNMLHLEQNTHLFEKMIDLAPTAFEKIQKMTSGFSNKKQQQQQEQSDKKENLDFEL